MVAKDLFIFSAFSVHTPAGLLFLNLYDFKSTSVRAVNFYLYCAGKVDFVSNAWADILRFGLPQHRRHKMDKSRTVTFLCTQAFGWLDIVPHSTVFISSKHLSQQIPHSTQTSQSSALSPIQKLLNLKHQHSTKWAPTLLMQSMIRVNIPPFGWYVDIKKPSLLYFQSKAHQLQKILRV